MNIDELNQLRTIVEAEYQKRMSAIDTLLDMVSGAGGPSASGAKKAPTSKSPSPKTPLQRRPALPNVAAVQKREPKKPRDGDENTLAGAMRKYIRDNPGRTRKQVVQAMLFSNKSKNPDSTAAGISVLIKQGDVAERDGGLHSVAQ